MPSPAEPASAGAAPAARVRALALAFALVAAGTGAAGAQEGPALMPSAWEETLAAGAAAAEDDAAPTQELELLRDRLLRLRSNAIEFETGAAGRVAEATARLNALGPPPAEGATETDQIAARRAQITAELSAAQLPLLEAQDAQRRADALIRQIDQVVRTRFAAELRSHGPTPLRPRHWAETARAVAENLRELRGQVATTLADPATRTRILRRVPLDLALAVIGIAIAFSLRVRLVRWVEGRLAIETRPKAVALLVNLRNFSKLIVPAVGAGLLFAALEPTALADPATELGLFHLPSFVLALIGASWLGSSVFAPKLPAFRLAPVSDAEAAAGARVTFGLGLVLAAHLFLRRYVTGWDLAPAEAATLAFPLIVVGGVLLWRVARVLRGLRREIDARDRGAPVGERTGAVGLGVLDIVRRGTLLIAFLAPALSAAGYLAAATYLLYSAILTLALMAAGVVLFDLLAKTFGALRERRDDPARDFSGGLAPVLIGSALGLVGLPFLALTWGVRATDLAGIWFVMRDGVTFGGMRISFATIVSFAVVFGALYALTRLLQSVLRSTVLPRTRMDSGGKNAVLAGVGYAGFFVAAIAAVSSTGIDLTSLAFVAGALSVGIGFGLQNIVSNFVSGIILLVERPIKEGDWIEVGGQMGYVRGISVRSTEIETFDRASVILPNSDLVAGTVLNRTHTGMSGRLTVPVGVSYSTDPRHVERVLLAIAEDHPMVLMDPAPRVLFMGFGPDSLNFEIRAWLRDVNFSLSARSDINFEIYERFKAENIAIPFPQRVLELKNPGSIAAALRPRRARAEDAEEAEAEAAAGDAVRGGSAAAPGVERS